MLDILIRFVIGGTVVSIFAVLGDLFKPKSFAGLFGAAPSVALATLGLTVSKEGAAYGSHEAAAMMAGAVALFVYASWVSRVMMHSRFKALLVTICTMPLWLAIAFGLREIWMK